MICGWVTSAGFREATWYRLQLTTLTEDRQFIKSQLADVRWRTTMTSLVHLSRINAHIQQLRWPSIITICRQRGLGLRQSRASTPWARPDPVWGCKRFSLMERGVSMDIELAKNLTARLPMRSELIYDRVTKKQRHTFIECFW